MVTPSVGDTVVVVNKSTWVYNAVVGEAGTITVVGSEACSVEFDDLAYFSTPGPHIQVGVPIVDLEVVELESAEW